jgi:6-phosphogluconolactonase
VKIEVLRDANAVAERAASLFMLAAQESASARGAFTAVLSGGSTPHALYAQLARQTASVKIPWRRVHLYWGDERCVPPDDPASNYGMACATLIDKVPIPPENVHRMHGEDEPEAAARAYEQQILAPPARAAAHSADVPVFDLVLLGLGADGHTASLFPHTDAVNEQHRLVVVNLAPDGGSRLTLTLPVIDAARRVFFVVTGGEKAGMVAEVLEGLRMPAAVPAQGVMPSAGTLTWLLDEAAAAELSPALRGAPFND